jgi:hypothetical protein
MFVTNSSMRLKFSSSEFPDLQVWDLMELELSIPILLVSIARAAGRSSSKELRTFFAKPHHIENFISLPDHRVHDLALFSPGHMNGSAGWKLEPLHELWRCRERQHDLMECWLFNVPGASYTDSCFGSDPQALDLQSLVYRSAGHAEAASRSPVAGPLRP